MWGVGGGLGRAQLQCCRSCSFPRPSSHCSQPPPVYLRLSVPAAPSSCAPPLPSWSPICNFPSPTPSSSQCRYVELEAAYLETLDRGPGPGQEQAQAQAQAQQWGGGGAADVEEDRYGALAGASRSLCVWRLRSLPGGCIVCVCVCESVSVCVGVGVSVSVGVGVGVG